MTDPLLDGRLPAGLRELGPVAAALARVTLIVGVSIVLAFVAARLLRMALRRAAGQNPEAVTAMLAAVRAVIVLVGLYQAFRSLSLPRGLDPIIEGACYVLAVVFAARAVVRVGNLALYGYIQRTAESHARERVQRDFLPLATTTLTVGVMFVAVIVTAHHFHQEVTSLVTAFGVGSLAIGLAAQATLGNTIAGFILLVDRPMRVGDRIRIPSGDAGEIREIGIRSTSMLLESGDLLIVPNAELLSSRLVNLSLPSELTRAEVRFKVAFAATEPVIGLLLAAALEDEGVVRAEAGGSPPSVGVAGIDGRTVELALRVMVRAGHGTEVTERLRRRVIARLAPDQLP